MPLDIYDSEKEHWSSEPVAKAMSAVKREMADQRVNSGLTGSLAKKYSHHL